VFHAAEAEAATLAVVSGVGLGFIGQTTRAAFPDLIEVLPPQPEWDAPLWLVTHVDLHRTAKVQAFARFLKDEARSWAG
jgi:DNA-binding transcriptional LysR family regulator